MSLWSQSLSWSLYGEKKPEEIAKSILAHLSMPVPRSWWENALKTGNICNASLLNRLQMELSKIIDPEESINSGLLVALAFTDMDSIEYDIGREKDKTEIVDYLRKARIILAERPDLVKLGKRIDEIKMTL